MPNKKKEAKNVGKKEKKQKQDGPKQERNTKENMIRT
jgi:hypothetical protein